MAAPEGLEPACFVEGAAFDPAIPAQQEVLGFLPGARPMRHDELLRYFEALDAASPRAELRTYSRSHESRRLVYLAVSDEATIGRLDSFREEHGRRMDPRGRAPQEDGPLLERAKAVAWMAYGIHGDELSSVDAAAVLAYWLVAGEDDRARRLRADLVILIDPNENPDGRERFLAQTTAFAHATPNPDTEDLSHTTVWPWGRGNHYLFDLNRDWFAMVHPESRRSAVIASWNPQLMVDSHEMGSDDSYLFSPPRHPFNPHLPPSELRWNERFAADQARALDARGYAYYTREWNEEFFPGYGSSWSSYRGAIGILYEMSSTEGTLVRQQAGTIRTYAQAVEHQMTSSVANLETLAAHRRSILEDFLADRRAIIRKGSEGAVRAWILPRGRHPERTDALVRLLREQGIEVLRSTGHPPAVSGLRDARTGAGVKSESLPRAGSWMVRLDQPSAALARVLLDPHVPMEAAFFREEREHLERGKGSRLYETTAWSMPLARGIEAHWTAQLPAGGWRDQPIEDSPGRLDRSDRAFGWLMEGTSDPSVFALSEMLASGISARVAEKPFRVEKRAFDRGAVLVKREGNLDDVQERLARIAARWKVAISAVATAKAEEGPDLGGNHFRPLVAPRVGVWSGAPVSPSSYGALWHLLDREMGLRFSGLDLSGFRRIDLSRYNILVFPPLMGEAGAYRELIGPEGIDRLRQWIHAGGTAIGIGAGAEFLADKGFELTKARLRRQALDRYPPVVIGPGAEEVEAAPPLRALGLRAPGGDGAQRTEDGAERRDVRTRRMESPDRAPGEGRARRARGEARGADPFDVAPLLGAGARPFAEGFELGAAVSLRPVSLSDWLRPVLPDGEEKPKMEEIERADERLRRFSPRGVFLRAELDTDRWLAWGLPDELPVLCRARDALVAEPPVEIPIRFAGLERLHLGGLLWPEAAGRLAGTAYAARERVGRGQVILFLDEPEFRGWTLGTRRLLLNALLYGPGLGTAWSTPW